MSLHVLPLAQNELTIVVILMIVLFVVPAIFQAFSKQAEEARRRQAAPRPKPRPANELDDEVGDFLRRAGRGRPGAPPAQGRPQPQGRPAAPGRPQAHPQGRPANELEEEVSDFLRRAAERRGGQPPMSPKPAPKPVMQRPRPAPPASPTRPPLSAPTPAAEPPKLRPVGAGLSEQVQEDLDTAEFRRRAAQLGVDVDQADERMLTHLHEAFDHQLGQLDLGATDSAPPEKPSYADRLTSGPAAPIGLAGLLGSGADLRRAVIVSEILRRPEERWT